MESQHLFWIFKLPLKRTLYQLQFFDKRDSFDFPIVNFPNLSGNIPHKSSYGVFIGELVRYARGCTHYEDFRPKTLSLISKLTMQGFTDKLLRKAFRKFCDSHVMLVQKYGPRILTFFQK